jgi:hypothetical protein
MPVNSRRCLPQTQPGPQSRPGLKRQRKGENHSHIAGDHQTRSGAKKMLAMVFGSTAFHLTPAHSSACSLSALPPPRPPRSDSPHHRYPKPILLHVATEGVPPYHRLLHGAGSVEQFGTHQRQTGQPSAPRWSKPLPRRAQRLALTVGRGELHARGAVAACQTRCMPSRPRDRRNLEVGGRVPGATAAR